MCPASCEKDAGTFCGGIRGNGSGGICFDSSSDARFKANIRDADVEPRAVIRQVRMRQWEPAEIDPNFPDKARIGYGVVAQELVEVYPDAVNAPDDGSPWTWSPTAMVPLLMHVCQQLDAECRDLRSHLDALRARVDALEPGGP